MNKIAVFCFSLDILDHIRLRLKYSLHGNIFADNYARELFKPLEDSASPYVCNENKNTFWL